MIKLLASVCIALVIFALLVLLAVYKYHLKEKKKKTVALSRGGAASSASSGREGSSRSLIGKYSGVISSNRTDRFDLSSKESTIAISSPLLVVDLQDSGRRAKTNSSIKSDSLTNEDSSKGTLYSTIDTRATNNKHSSPPVNTPAPPPISTGVRSYIYYC
jgi:hypothetical protein